MLPLFSRVYYFIVSFYYQLDVTATEKVNIGEWSAVHGYTAQARCKMRSSAGAAREHDTARCDAARLQRGAVPRCGCASWGLGLRLATDSRSPSSPGDRPRPSSPADRLGGGAHKRPADAPGDTRGGGWARGGGPRRGPGARRGLHVEPCALDTATCRLTAHCSCCCFRPSAEEIHSFRIEQS
jgi:hypothetical protein